MKSPGCNMKQGHIPQPNQQTAPHLNCGVLLPAILFLFFSVAVHGPAIHSQNLSGRTTEAEGLTQHQHKCGDYACSLLFTSPPAL